MSLKTPRIPKYRLHRGSGQAFVQIKGKRHYLGKHGTEVSHRRYQRFVAELVSSPEARVAMASSSPGRAISVAELCAAYLSHAERHYVKNGELTTRIYHVYQELKVLRTLYEDVAVDEVGPLAIQAMQQHLVSSGLSRRMINDRIRGIKRVFRWGVTQELVPVTTYQAMAVVPGLRKNRTDARETDPVLPVPDADVEKTLPLLPDIVADMVRFQRYTGSRPIEVCIIRPCDVDRDSDVWVYRPESHKTEHRGRDRLIFIGAQAQDVLRPYLLRPSESYCFSPAESEARRYAQRRASRKTPVSYGNRPGTNRRARPKRKPKATYNTNSYRRAIRRACEKACVEKWSPNQLRHSAATEIRQRFGIEAAQVALGHAHANVTQVYAERDAELAREVARQIG